MKRREIYEEAADQIADGRSRYCCNALGRDSCLKPEPRIRREFREVFGLDRGDPFEVHANREGWYRFAEPELSTDVRLMALSLAYSVLTYRRPKSRSRKRRFSEIAR